jgi:hypothetical protein
LWILKNRPEGLSPYSERNIIQLHNKKAADLYTESLSGIRFIPETSVEEDAKATDEAIKEGVLDIAGATFVSGSLSCRCDLIKRRSDGTYALYIIRAAAHIRQTVCHDASYQVFILATKGIRISRVFFVKLNTCFEKGVSDERELFLLENISSRVASLVSGVPNRAKNMLSAIAKDEMPRQPIHNGCFNPSDCENREECFKCLPEDNVFSMSGVSHEIKYKLYELEEQFSSLDFARCSKSMIVNLEKIEYLSPLFSGKMEAHLKNGENVVISRQYIRSLKNRLGV